MADSYFDKSNQHAVYLGRTATHLINEYPNNNLSAAYKTARSILIDFGDLTTYKQRDKVMAQVTEALYTPALTMWRELTVDLEDLAVNESAFSAKMVGAANDVALVTPAAKEVVKIVRASKLILEGSAKSQKRDVWTKHIENSSRSIARAYNRQIKAGFRESETLNQITKRLRTVTNGLLKNEADALVRTGVSHYANQAKDAMAAANSDIIKNKYFNSMFDSRRTLICSHFAQNPVYRVDDKGAPVPPLHWNCRSNWLFLIGDQTEPFGARPAIGSASGQEAEDRYYKRKNALDNRRDNPNIDGQTSSKVKYRGRKDSDTFSVENIGGKVTPDEWLRKQAAWFQDATLGKKRAELFRGGLKIDKFTDLTGRKLTIKELYESGV